MPESKFLPLDTAPSTDNVVPIDKAPQVAAGAKFMPIDPSDIRIGSKPKDIIGSEARGAFKLKYGDATQYLEEGTAKALPIVGGVVGSLAGPAASAGLAGIGGLAGRALMKDAYNDTSPTSIGDQAKDFALTAGSTYLGGKFLGPIQSRFMSALGATVFGRGMDKIQQYASGDDTEKTSSSLPQEIGGFGLDFGKNLLLQLAGEGIIRGVRSKVGPQESIPITIKDANTLTREGIGAGTEPQTTQEYGQQGQKVVQGNLAKATAFERAGYKAFEDTHIANNTEPLTIVKGFEDSKLIDPKTNAPTKVPVTQDIQLKGPIYLSATSQKAAEFKPMLDKFFADEAPNLPDYARGPLIKLQKLVDHVAEGVTTLDATGQEIHIPVTDWETAKQLKTAINDTVGRKIFKNLGEGGLSTLAKTLKQDIDSSVGMWKDGPQAQADLAQANETSRMKNLVFNKEIQNKLPNAFDPTKGKASEFFDTAYKTPEGAKNMMEALGPSNAQYIKGDYFDNVLSPKAFGQNYSEFKPSAAIQDLENPNSVSRTIFSAPERNGMLRFYRAAEAAGPNSSVGFSDGKFLVNIGAAVGRVLGFHPAGASVIRIAARDFADKVINQPGYANLASRLVKIPSDSLEAQSITKTLLKGLKGSSITINLDNKPYSAKVNEAGKILLGDVENPEK